MKLKQLLHQFKLNFMFVFVSKIDFTSHILYQIMAFLSNFWPSFPPIHTFPHARAQTTNSFSIQQRNFSGMVNRFIMTEKLSLL